MRAQLLAAEVSDIDAVLWTHDHADHTHGIDDLRQLMHIRNGAPVPGYARPFTLEQLQHKFHYAFFGRALYRPTSRSRRFRTRWRSATSASPSPISRTVASRPQDFGLIVTENQ
jgi:metal-dependent hydrolase (beta-lactamase superfamily II)